MNKNNVIELERRVKSETWKIKYNEYRPHDALGRMPPAMYMRKLKLENSSLELST